MREGLSRRMREAAFWGLSAGLPLLALLLLREGGPHPARDGPGIAVLALPAGLAPQRDPLAGWPVLDLPPLAAGQPVAATAAAETGEETGPEPVEPDLPPPVRLFGAVGQGGIRMYCFLDTRNRRWFRLAPGETDGPAAVSLVAGEDPDTPVLVDLAGGARFRIHSGRLLLEPVPAPAPLTVIE